MFQVFLWIIFLPIRAEICYIPNAKNRHPYPVSGILIRVRIRIPDTDTGYRKRNFYA